MIKLSKCFKHTDIDKRIAYYRKKMNMYSAFLNYFYQLKNILILA